MGLFSRSYNSTSRLGPVLLVLALHCVGMAAAQSKPGLLGPQYVNGVYIPSTLLLIGTAIMKKEWVPYAAALAVVLGAWKVYNNRESCDVPNKTLPCSSCSLQEREKIHY
jgi:hypothetical protein